MVYLHVGRGFPIEHDHVWMVFEGTPVYGCTHLFRQLKSPPGKWANGSLSGMQHLPGSRSFTPYLSCEKPTLDLVDRTSESLSSIVIGRDARSMDECQVRQDSKYSPSCNEMSTGTTLFCLLSHYLESRRTTLFGIEVRG